MSQLRPGMPLGPQKKNEPKIQKNYQQTNVQVGNGRNMDEEERHLRGKHTLERTYENQQDSIGAPADPEIGYDGKVSVSRASKDKVERKRKDMPFMPATHKEGSTAGLSAPGLTWGSEDAEDRGENDVEGWKTEQAMTTEDHRREQDKSEGLYNVLKNTQHPK